jgi:hypothetical protein
VTKVAIEDPELVEQIRSYLELQGIDIPENVPVAVQLPGSAKAPQRCMSGSGLMTSGGRFYPGYDAKLKAALYAIIRGKPEAVPEELKEHGPRYIPVEDWTPELARQSLVELDWPEPIAETATQRKAREKKLAKEAAAAEAEANGEVEGEGDTDTGASTKAGRKRAAAKAREAEEESETVDA